tara:strand:+ start:66 stop:857 length:792 start_codon:yes stop_codon:yes gene_type:complete
MMKHLNETLFVLCITAGLSCGDRGNEATPPPNADETNNSGVQTLTVNARPNVAFRSGPSTSAPLISEIPFGENVEPIDTSSHKEALLGFTEAPWRKVQFNSQEGWIYSPLLNEPGEENHYIFTEGRLIHGLPFSKLQKCRQFDAESFPANFNSGCFQIFGGYTKPDIDCMSDTHVGLSATGEFHIEMAHSGSSGRWVKSNERILLIFDSAYNLHYDPEDVPPPKDADIIELIHGQLIYRSRADSAVAICMQKYQVARQSQIVQ